MEALIKGTALGGGNYYLKRCPPYPLACQVQAFAKQAGSASSFDGKKKREGSKEFNEKQRLIHKVKKERKGAMREIKKDMQFLARQKLQEHIDR